MRITFDPDFNGGFWPGPLRLTPGKTATAGETWVGPRILRGILETALGLGGIFPSRSERTISFAQTVLVQEGFWSKSAEKDPIGVARVLLRWIDRLKLHGWNGQPPPKTARALRLTDLSKIAPSVLAGTPDRLNAIAAALDKHRPDIESIETYEPIDRLFPLWRTIFAKLASSGVSIKYSPPPPAAAPLAGSSSSVSPSPLPSYPAPTLPSSDLRRAFQPEFTPAGDGSLILFRPYNPLDAAENIAAWLSSLASHDELSDTVVISSDVALDEALRRFGLPVTGAYESISDAPSLQVLPLVLAMGWDPPDPQRALELLLLPDGFIPGIVARNLRKALQQWPAIGSPDWDAALLSSLDQITDASKRDNIHERLDLIFRPDAKIHTPYPATSLLLRAQAVKKWAAARRFASPEPESETTATMDKVITQCATLEKLIGLSGFDAFTEPQLLKLNIEIAGSLGSPRRHTPQVGIAAVASPGAIAGPARHIIWWDFTLESAPEPPYLPFSRSELATLESMGARLTPASELAADQAHRRRRPFEQTSETLLLVCPRFGEDGEDRHPHPLWDEVAANKHKDANFSLLEPTQLLLAHPHPTRLDSLLQIPAPRRAWSVSAGIITLPPHHSPTSLQDLVGCPFKWALTYLGYLHDPEIAALTDNNTLMGKLSHEILAEVLRAAPPDGLSAQSLAENLFAIIGPKLAAPLFLPGAPVQLAFARKATADASRDLVEILKHARLPIVAVELPISKKTAEIELIGRLDLIAGDPPVIIDLKWSSESFHRDKLKNGTATQLAAYSFMTGTDGGFPPVAFFVIRNQRLIAKEGAPFAPPNVETVGGPSIEETWDGFLIASLVRFDTVKKGRFEALAIPLPDETGVIDKDTFSDGIVALTPPCKFCSFGYLCGFKWENA
jgi:ATP-dependent helicase/nuclease subunit B